MACFHPLTAYKLNELNESGKAVITFNRGALARVAYEELRLPCGQCIGCRCDKARDWAVRCVHEASRHEENCFITLTYNDQTLDGRKSLEKRNFPLFMKRLRKEVGRSIRFLHCGEYGTVCKVCGRNRKDCRKLRRHKFRSVTRKAAPSRMHIWLRFSGQACLAKAKEWCSIVSFGDFRIIVERKD